MSSRQRTLEEFLRLPDLKPALEYEDGRVTRKEWPGLWHSALQTAMLALLTRAGGRAIHVLPEVRVTFAGSSLVPDVAAYFRERVARDADGLIADDLVTPPDIAVEVLTPKQPETPTVRRCFWYVANGVRVALLIDPKDHSVLIFRAGTEPLVLRRTGTIDLTDIAPGLSVDVEQLFASLRA